MKKFLIIALAISLGGCATKFGTSVANVVSAAQNFSITQGQLDSTRTTYDGFVLAPLNKYASLVRCKTGQTLTLNNPCHDRVLLKKIRAVDAKIEIAFNNTQDKITSGDSKGAVSAYQSLNDAIAIAKELINQTGIHVLGV